MTSLQAFLKGLIDYAGLFPPASLSLEAAIHHFATYQKEKDAWMLGRFVIPASRIGELAPYMSLFSADSVLPLAVTGRRSRDAKTCLDGLHEDLAAVSSFRDRFKDAVKVSLFEQPLPRGAAEEDLLKEIGEEATRLNLHTFCEVTDPLDEDWEQHVFRTLDAIAAYNIRADKKLGFKLRTGGVAADAFPDTYQIAVSLVGSRDRGIPMKFTAGLHHPVRMYRDEVGVKMHGFLNVFTSGMMVHVHHLSIAKAAEILTDESASDFSFSGSTLAWRDMTLTDFDIEELRRTTFCSYGSCSFREPREGLKEAGIL